MEKRSFLMIYDNHNNIPNGDPFTGEQRYDNASQKIMVSDLRIKRFIRDKFIELLSDTDTVFVKYDAVEAKKLISGIKGDITGSSFSFRKYLLDKGLLSNIGDDLKTINKEYTDVVSDRKYPELQSNIDDELTDKEPILSDVKTPKKSKKSKSDKKSTNDINLDELMKEFIDVRLFGGILTDTGSNSAIEGSIQFKNLSYSLNKIKTEIFQNTTVFPSKISNEQGSIGTTTIVPYSIISVEGWLNEATAEQNNLTELDVNKMLSCMWLGIRDKNTRSKSDQSPILLIEVVYREYDYIYNPSKKVYKTIPNLDSLVKIKLNSDVDEFDIRDRSDFELQLDGLIDASTKENVKIVNFFTENEELKNKLSSLPNFNFKELLS